MHSMLRWFIKEVLSDFYLQRCNEKVDALYSLAFAFIESDNMSSDEKMCDMKEEMGLIGRKVGDYRTSLVDILSVRLPILDYYHCTRT